MILISARTLATTLDVIVPFASKDPTLPTLCGVHFRPRKRGVEVWATDRYRVAALQVELDNAAEFDPFTLSTAALAGIRTLWKPTRGHNPTLSILTNPDNVIVTPDGDGWDVQAATIAHIQGSAKAWTGVHKALDGILTAALADPDPEAVAKAGGWGLDPNLLTGFSAAAKHHGQVVLTFHGPGKAVGAAAGDLFRAAIMPTRRTGGVVA